MRPVNPAKLLLSKWTAVIPQNREKHFLVTQLIRNQEQEITGCILQAVINGRDYEMDWRELKDTQHWLQGWK